RDGRPESRTKDDDEVHAGRGCLRRAQPCEGAHTLRRRHIREHVELEKIVSTRSLRNDCHLGKQHAVLTPRSVPGTRFGFCDGSAKRYTATSPAASGTATAYRSASCEKNACTARMCFRFFR